MLTTVSEKVSSVVLVLKAYGSKRLGKACIIGSSLLFVRYLCLRIYRKIYKIPPGPIGLPYFGSLMSLAMNEGKFFGTMSAYGCISSFYLNDLKVILVNDSKLSIELLKNEHMVSRPYTNPQWMGNFGNTYESMSTMAYGKEWKWVSKFCV